MGEHALLAPDHEHGLVLEALGVVEGHQGAEALVGSQRILIREERDLSEELLQRSHLALALRLAVGVELRRDVDELLEVLQLPLSYHGIGSAALTVSLEGLAVPAFGEQGPEQLGDRGGAVAIPSVPKAAHDVRKATDGLERRRAEPGDPLGRA